MSFKTAIQSYLSTDAGVSALCSTRVYPSMAPAAAVRPYIVYQEISAGHEHHLLGAGGLVSRRLQLTCYADTALGAEILAETSRDALQGFRGLMGTVNLDVRDVRLENDLDGFQDPTDGTSKGIHSKVMDFIIWHTESIPTF